MNNFILSLAILALLFSCSPLKSLRKLTHIDTSDRYISLSEKKTFYVPQEGVYASNEFDGARLNGFESKNKDTIQALITPENLPINKSPWYSFKLWSNQPKNIVLQFHYPKGYKHRYIPKISFDKKNWNIAGENIFQIKDTIAYLRAKITSDTMWVSAQELHNTNKVSAWIKELKERHPDIVHLSSSGESVFGRNLPVMELYKAERRKKNIVVVMTRQHPAEVTGYLAFQEFIQTILTKNELSDQFLSSHIVLCFPIVNPDGVDFGHWRHNATGIDTNRDWAFYRQKEIKQIAGFIARYAKKQKRKIILGIDFHSTDQDVFYTPSPEKRKKLINPKLIEQWLARTERSIQTQYPEYKLNEDPTLEARPVSKNWFIYLFKASAITYEIGDETPREFIGTKAKSSAKELMRLLVE